MDTWKFATTDGIISTQVKIKFNQLIVSTQEKQEMATLTIDAVILMLHFNDDIEILYATQPSHWMMISILLPEPMWGMYPINDL